MLKLDGNDRTSLPDLSDFKIVTCGKSQNKLKKKTLWKKIFDIHLAKLTQLTVTNVLFRGFVCTHMQF